MYVLDSDHLSILQRKYGNSYDVLARRLSAARPSDVFVTIITFHEQFNGWTKFVSRSKNSSSLVRGYSELAGVITTFARAQVLAFSDAAAEVYDELKAQKVRVGTMDLRIASIVIANQMTLLTKNTVDFSRIPNFTFADWTIV